MPGKGLVSRTNFFQRKPLISLSDSNSPWLMETGSEAVARSDFNNSFWAKEMAFHKLFVEERIKIEVEND